MSVRGVIGQINREMKRIERENARPQREAEKEYRAAVKREKQARKAEERAAKQLARAKEVDRKRLEKETKEAHVAAMQAKVELKNRELLDQYNEIDSILEATLDIDDYVDLDSLRIQVEHPPFSAEGLDKTIAPPPKLTKPEEPTLVIPPKPTGLRGLFGAKRHAAQVEAAQLEYERAKRVWNRHLTTWEADVEAMNEKHTRDEENRLVQLEGAKNQYAEECKTREKEASDHNASIDSLIAGLGYGTVEAVQEYVSIVLSNSIYPEHFPVTNEFSFDPNTAELRLRVLIPPPDRVPNVKAYKYTKTSDEITSTSLSQKACRDRYASAIHQLALRSIHEVFEADRRGIIHTIDLEVGTETTQPSTGLETFIPFVAVGSERKRFLEFNLSSVIPSATLDYLGAAISKNPFSLVPIDASGIRRS